MTGTRGWISGVCTAVALTCAISAAAEASAPASASGEVVRLNNLVRQLPVTQKSVDGAVAAAFKVPDAGWTFVEFTAPVQAMELKCGDRRAADTVQLVESREFMIDLAAGDYTLTAKALFADPANELKVKRVHRIPEIYYYAPAIVGGLEVLDGNRFWESIGGQLLQSTNLLAPGALTKEELALYRQAGRKVFFNVMSKPVSDGEIDQFVTQVQPRLDLPEWDGFTVDEFNFGDPKEYARYAEALGKIKNPDGKRMYTWSYGVKYNDKPAQLDFVRLSMNPPSGKGRLMTEVYLETKETEAEAEAFIRKRIVEDAASILSQLPGLAPGYGIVPGNFNAMPILTQETVPEADYKYYLDRQLYVIANDPACRDLGLVGYWGGNYCQEDMQRWCLALLRHYFVEGKKEMLSERYGYRYIPGILKNGDFLRDLSSWEALPAEAGSIRQDAVKDHGYLMQCRWGKTASAQGGVYNGDAAMVMVKSAKGANVLRQKMVNLIPGQPYMLQFVVGSYDDAANKVFNPRRYGIDAVIDPAEAGIRSQGLYIDRRENHRYSKDGKFSRANLHRIIFVPKAKEVMLTLTDAASTEKPGSALMVNFVQVKPYFAPEMLP